MDITVKDRIWKITDGPGRDEIYDSMKYCHEIVIPIRFRIIEERPAHTDGCNTYKVETKNIEIHCIKHNSGSGYDLVIEGFLDADLEGDFLPYTFEAFYNARVHKGTIRLKKGL
jgi:hypothetical protein